MNTDKCLLVTGGAGFIGSALIRHLIRNTKCRVINVDRLTYAGNPESLAEVWDDPRHFLEQVDICDQQAVAALFYKHRPEAVLHLAAESHVDRSIAGPAEFMQTNFMGTYSLLQAACAYWKDLNAPARKDFRFVHVSTDEVYGDLDPEDPPFTEDTAYAPSSPYAASKAASDHLVRAWQRTYGFPAIITNCSNNYGPYQFPEKLIPLMILNAQEEKSLPVYGQGTNIRDWLFVDDHVRALLTVLKKGVPGRTYNIGGNCEKKNIEVIKAVCAILDKVLPSKQKSIVEKGYASLVQYVTDRPGHDLRYAINDSRIRTELGWKPMETFESGLKKTVQWYIDNSKWVERVRTGEYRAWIKRNYELRDREV